MGSYENAGAGIKKMYIASLGSLICAVLLIVPGVNIVAAFAALAFMVVSMIGLYQAGRDIEGCYAAFKLTIANIIVSLVGALFQSGFMHLIIQIAGYVISFMVTYLVCTSVGDVMIRMGNAHAAYSSETAWKVCAVCNGLLILFVIAAMFPGFGMQAVIIRALITMMPSVIAEIFYMLFLSKCNHALNG